MFTATTSSAVSVCLLLLLYFIMYSEYSTYNCIDNCTVACSYTVPGTIDTTVVRVQYLVELQLQLCSTVVLIV